MTTLAHVPGVSIGKEQLDYCSWCSRTSPLNFLCSYDKKGGASVLRQPDFSFPDHMVDIPYS